MPDAEVQLQPDSTGKQIDNTTETTGAGTVYRQRISVAAVGSNNQLAIDASGNLTVNAAGGSLAVTNAGLTNLDVALSTRLKSADTLAKVTTVDTITNAVAVTNAGLTNLDVALSTRTKPADQQHAIIDSSALPAGAATEATGATGWETLLNLMRTQNAILRSISFQLSFLNHPRLRIEDLSPFIQDEALQ